MKIGVDCHVFSGKFQGSRTYLLKLYEEILALNSQHEFFFLGHWNGAKPYGDEVNYANYLSSSRWRRLTYQTAPLVRQFQLDVLHNTYISPLVLPCKSLLTVHDVIFETHPQFFTRAEVLRNKLLIRHSARKATQVHTISEFSRQALIEAYRLPEEQVKIVPCGVDLARFNADNRQDAVEIVHEKFKIKDYILAVGRLEPRKNHLGLLRAYALLTEQERESAPLVIVGQRDFHFQEFFGEIDRLKLKDQVSIIESIDDDLLPSIYKAARLFAYPSFAEGFGMPPLEAMACGVPVISSNTSAMPEVVGDGGLLVNPNSPEEIAEAMLNVLSNPLLAEELASKGLRQASNWSWASAAKKYLDALSALEAVKR